ncbi:MAG: GGDEF domain-containing protein, partial [Dechloromonas agitata]|nr:GGDEF domain-containing protein [Dechloromonas agitata]
IAGRLGGEEFAVMLPETSIGQAIMVAERLRSQIVSAPVTLADGQCVAYTLSIGIAVLTAEHEGLDRLLQQADQALYAAKERGRNRVVSYAADRPA